MTKNSHKMLLSCVDYKHNVTRKLQPTTHLKYTLFARAAFCKFCAFSNLQKKLVHAKVSLPMNIFYWWICWITKLKTWKCAKCKTTKFLLSKKHILKLPKQGAVPQNCRNSSSRKSLLCFVHAGEILFWHLSIVFVCSVHSIPLLMSWSHLIAECKTTNFRKRQPVSREGCWSAITLWAGAEMLRTRNVLYAWWAPAVSLRIYVSYFHPTSSCHGHVAIHLIAS